MDTFSHSFCDILSAYLSAGFLERKWDEVPQESISKMYSIDYYWVFCIKGPSALYHEKRNDLILLNTVVFKSVHGVFCVLNGFVQMCQEEK